MSKIPEQLSFHFDTSAANTALERAATSLLPEYQPASSKHPIKSIDVDTSNAGDVALLLLRIQNGDVGNQWVSFDGLVPTALEGIIVDLNDKDDLRKFVLGLDIASIDDNGCEVILAEPHIFILNKIKVSSAEIKGVKEGNIRTRTECRPAHYDPNVGIGLALNIEDAYVWPKAIESKRAKAILSMGAAHITLRKIDKTNNHEIYDLQVRAVQGQIGETQIPICDFLYRPVPTSTAVHRQMR